MDIEDSVENENEVKLRSIFRKLAGNDWEFNWREQKEIMDYKLAKGSKTCINYTFSF